MSGSPKYSSPELDAEIERQLREELRRQQEEERRRRREEQNARREQAIRDRASALQSELGQIRNESSALLEGLGEFVDANERANVENQAAGLKSALDRAVESPEVLKRSSRQFKTLRREMERVAERARGRQLESNLQMVSEQANQLQTEFNQLDRKFSFRHDQIGLENVESLLRRSREKIASGDLGSARANLQSAQEQFGAHRDRIVTALAQIEKERSDVRTNILDAYDALTTAESDPLVSRWKVSEVATIRTQLEELDETANSKDFQEVPHRVDELLISLEQVEKSASEAQLASSKRKYITDSIQSVMEEFGFEMESGFPRLQDEGSPGSEQVILARRLSGERIAATVPLDGDVWYDVDGYRFEAGADKDGRSTSSCDGAQAQIEMFHEMLGSKFGVKMGKLLWDDQDPDRILNEARNLPRDSGDGSDLTQASS